MTTKEAKEMATTICSIIAVDLHKGFIRLKNDSQSAQNLSEIFLIASDYKTGAYTSYSDSEGNTFYEVDIKVK